MASKRSLHFIRHAESLFNEVFSSEVSKFARLNAAKHLVDAGLSERGKNQAKNARNTIKHLNIDLAITSPYSRTLSTCFLAHGHKDVMITPLCGEKVEFICDYGTPKEQLQQQIPSKLDLSHVRNDIWWFNPSQSADHQAVISECLEMKKLGLSEARIEPEVLLKKRAQQFYEFLLSRPEKNIAVFSHFQFLSKFLHWHFGREELHIGNAEIVSFGLPSK